MSNIKAFRADWYSSDAFVDFCKLKVEETGTAMQIINLIYIHNGPIDNDPKFIGKSCNITSSRCARIISELIRKGVIYLNEKNKIHQKRCGIELQNIEKRREISSKNGKKGSNTRWNNEEIQRDSNGVAITSHLANTSTKKETINNTNTHTNARQMGGHFNPVRPFNIEIFLDDDAHLEIKRLMPGYDFYNLIREYNAWIKAGNKLPPANYRQAFIGWCRKYKERHPL